MPKELRKLILIEDDEALKELIHARVSAEIDRDIRKIESKLQDTMTSL